MFPLHRLAENIMEHINILSYFLITLIIMLFLRILYVVYQVFVLECKIDKKITSLRTIYCVGSGGHTTELLRLVKYMNPKKYQPRLYILAYNDANSEVKVHRLEKELGNYEYNLSRIPRSRNVKQSYLSSVGSTLYATVCTIPVIYNFKPDIILCNGPGTCIPICFISFLFRCVFILDCRIIFIESICRVRTLSLTGKILQLFADIIVVQWPQLREVCVRAKYFGRLT